MFSVLKQLVRIVCLAAGLTVMLQNPLIFPGAVDAVLHPPRWTPPERVESIKVQTQDGKVLESWRYPPKAPQAGAPVVIVLHGNSGDLQSFFWAQQRFEAAGLLSYGFDYRGYGKSTGWPSENGLYEDAEAVWKYVVEREKVDPDHVLLFGISLGSGPATYLAEKYKVKTLVLIAPYSSIPDVVSEREILSVLSPFVWIDFPNQKRIASLTTTCVVATHGMKDVKILPVNTKRLENAYRGSGTFTSLFDEEADHDNIVDHIWPRLVPAMESCVNR